MSQCYFCPNKLDNSDEHIILNSLNGKLHSKEIICSDCNNFFGLKLDSVAKDFFNPILLALDFKNAAGIIAENLRGEDDYLLKNDKSIVQRKPKMLTKKLNGKTIVSINGDEKNAIKLFDKQVEKLLKQGHKKIGSIIEKQVVNVPLRLKVEFKSNVRIDLLLNKIAIEFCALNHISTEDTQELASKIRSLDENLENVFYYNSTEDYRDYKSGEISHYIKLWSVDKVVYAYVELLNTICAVIILARDYNGSDLNYEYYQDAITGEKLTEFPKVDSSKLLSIIENNVKFADFSEMANMVFKRKMDRDFIVLLDEVIIECRDRLHKELLQGKITDLEFREKYVHETTSFLANYQIENPYIWEDLDDANNDELNYLHSNLRENQFEEFCAKNSNWIGSIIKIDDLKSYAVEEFIKIPVAKQNGIVVVNVKVILFNGFDRIYIPYREFFETLSE